MRDNTQVLCYRNCPTQFYFRFVLGLEKIKEDEVEHDKNFGKAIHTGLKLWNQGNSEEKCLEAFKKDYPSQLNPEDQAKTQENGVKLLSKYFQRYKSDREKYEIVDVEKLIEFNVGQHLFCAKLDTKVRDKKYDQMYSLEHKTTKKNLDYKYWSIYEPNSQLCSQTSAIKSQDGECAGVIVDAMSFGFRKNKYKDQPAGFHMDFGRMEFNLNQAQLDQWKRSTEKTLDDIQSDLESNKWAMNTDACRFCSFRSICQAAWSWEEDQELILLTYQQKENPLDYMVSEEAEVA